MKLTDLKLNPENPRQISEDKLTKLAQSIKDFPKMMVKRPIVYDENKIIIGGNMRYRAIQSLGMTEIPDDWTADASDFTPDERKRFIMQDNAEMGTTDWDIVANQYELEDLDAWGIEVPQVSNNYDDGVNGALAENFIAPPFSVLDTRQGYWQDRRNNWLKLGIQSEIGRATGLLGGGKSGCMLSQINGGTSVFDPVLCELMYTWFNIPNGTVLDPFAGGSVRGIVASELEQNYTGIELSAEQIKSNIEQADKICKKNKPSWIAGDSNVILDTIDKTFDFLFTCPPYADLEVYSDNIADISNMPYDKFLSTYQSIIAKAVDKLADNRFAVFVVGEVRAKDGKYYNFVGDTIKAFINTGLSYYNEIILVNSIGTLPLRAGRQFNNGRKIGKCHQNILVFYKGDVKNIKLDYPAIELSNNE